MDTKKVNVNPVERVASTALGGALFIRSLFRNSLTGDAMALALLYRGVTGHSYLYQALDLNTANGRKLLQGKQSTDNTLQVERAITIKKPADEIYSFWRKPQNLARIMNDFAEVTELSEGRSHWVVRGPLDRRMEWDSQIVEERPGELIRWQSVEGAQLPNEGSVRFRSAPKDWGTEVLLTWHFNPQGGVVTNKLIKSLDIVPRLLAEKALRRLKSLIETGEAPTLQRNPSARADNILTPVSRSSVPTNKTPKQKYRQSAHAGIQA